MRNDGQYETILIEGDPRLTNYQLRKKKEKKKDRI